MQCRSKLDDPLRDIDSVGKRLEPIMTKLAKAVLTNQPENVELFCFNFFARRIGEPEVDVQGQPVFSDKDASTYAGAVDEDLDDDNAAIEADATVALIRAKSRKAIITRKNYDSTDEEDNGDAKPDENSESASHAHQINAAKSIGKATPATGTDRGVVDCKTTLLDHDGAIQKIVSAVAVEEPAKGADDSTDTESVKTAHSAISRFEEDDAEDDHNEPKVVTMKATTVEDVMDMIPIGGELSPEEKVVLNMKVSKISKDPRMRQLFEIWDADASGAVDLEELVVALHKFNRVMEEGTDLKRASAALAWADNDATAHMELNYKEFARLIVQFCDEEYGRSFDDMAAHMLAVARSTSERAALAAEEGGDVEQIMAADAAEIEILKATVKGVESSVQDSVRKIKTVRKVMFN